MRDPAAKMNWSTFRTQKARGIGWLCRGIPYCGMEAPGHMPRSTISSQHVRTVRVWPYDAAPSFPFFARPCPETPRHGFVESRLVADASQLAEVVMETYKEDPEAEIIMMPKLTGQYSAVATPTQVSIGQKNDGVTGGKGVMVRIPTPNPQDIGVWNLTLAGQKGPEGEVVYLEVVENLGKMVMVQARYGPATDAMVNFIPEEVTVTGVFTLGQHTEPSLLDWEKWVKEWKQVPGFVVYAPGSSLASHFAVHCIQNGVPFLTQKEAPKVGDLLRKDAPPKITHHGRRAFRADMQRRLLHRIYGEGQQATIDQAQRAGLSLSIAHAHSVWGNGALFAKLRARGFISLLRFTALACVGEARHFRSSGPGRPWDVSEDEGWCVANGMGPEEIAAYKAKRCREGQLDWTAPGLLTPNPEGWTLGQKIAPTQNWKPFREEVYHTLTGKTVEELMELLLKARADLAQPGWIGSMGGDAWFQAANSGIEAWDAWLAFEAQPSGKNWRRLCEKWNIMAFAVHNGGKLLTKWCNADLYASNPALGIVACSLVVVGEFLEAEVEQNTTEELDEAGEWAQPLDDAEEKEDVPGAMVEVKPIFVGATAPQPLGPGIDLTPQADTTQKAGE